VSNTAGFVREDGKPAAYDLTGQETGRPTSYRPEYCEKVVEWGKLGKSRAWMCSRLDITPKTMASWEAAHPDFLSAMIRARMHAQAHWEDQGHDNLLTAGFNSSVWSRSMGARFPDDWRETSRNEHAGPGGGPIQVAKVERVIVDPNNSDA
jgi:hypothetical protein